MVIKILNLPLSDIPMAEAKIVQMRGSGYEILHSQIVDNVLFLLMELPDRANRTDIRPDQRGIGEKDAQIIETTGGRTKNSGSPMWRCVCADGTRVNVFKHTDAEKNNFLKFETAGYAPEMIALKDGERLAWKTYPIRVKLVKPAGSDFWDVASVDPRPDDAKPDPKIPDEIPF